MVLCVSDFNFPVSQTTPVQREGKVYLFVCLFIYSVIATIFMLPIPWVATLFISKRIYFAFSQTAPAQTEEEGDLFIYLFI